MQINLIERRLRTAIWQQTDLLAWLMLFLMKESKTKTLLDGERCEKRMSSIQLKLFKIKQRTRFIQC